MPPILRAKSFTEQEKNRLVAAARLALLELSAEFAHAAKSQRYFAKPGEAEWGC